MLLISEFPSRLAAPWNGSSHIHVLTRIRKSGSLNETWGNNPFSLLHNTVILSLKSLRQIVLDKTLLLRSLSSLLVLLQPEWYKLVLLRFICVRMRDDK